ncbi:MAG TPA: hypothetical protein VFL69_10835 [Marmoricola sp.]|jgi:hypothetical protein|nr:hypothetical protein [Marmoricola sp.]
MKPNRPVAFAMGAITALVLGSGTAYAATGGKFILGHANSASKTSTLTNTRGTALALDSKAGTPPLKVNRSVKVPNLNADKLDGKSSSAFALVAGKTGTITGSGYVVNDNSGTPMFIAAVATCPSGTKMTGGGGEDDTAGGSLWLTEPVSANTWAVASTQTDLSSTNAGKVFATVQCWNPRGSVAGSQFRTMTKKPSDFPDLMAAMQRKSGN